MDPSYASTTSTISARNRGDIYNDSFLPSAFSSSYCIKHDCINNEQLKTGA
jgi:hypothetical protein